MPEDELPDELSDELPESLPESLPQYSGTEPDSDYTPPGSPPGSTPSTPPPRRRRAFTEEGEFFDLLAFGNSHGVSAVAVGRCARSRTRRRRPATRHAPSTRWDQVLEQPNSF